MGLPPKVLRKGITDMVRISDARMSGTAYGTVVLHTSPEAARGGPLAVVRTGDLIELDVAGRRLHLDISGCGTGGAAGGMDAAAWRARPRVMPGCITTMWRAPIRAPTWISLSGCRGNAGGAGKPLMRHAVALVGIGKIALDQHVPALSSSSCLGSCGNRQPRRGRSTGCPPLRSLDAMLAAHPEVEVVSLCLPPVPRFAVAEAALRAGRHVMLEKPPGATLAEVQALQALAAAARADALCDLAQPDGAWGGGGEGLAGRARGHGRADRLARGCAALASGAGLGVRAGRHGGV